MQELSFNEEPSNKIEKRILIPEEVRESPEFRGLFEEEALKYLKGKDAKWFYDNFSGEVSPKGYLIDKFGVETNFLPSQNITAGIDEVERIAFERFKKEKEH